MNLNSVKAAVFMHLEGIPPPPPSSLSLEIVVPDIIRSLQLVKDPALKSFYYWAISVLLKPQDPIVLLLVNTWIKVCASSFLL